MVPSRREGLEGDPAGDWCRLSAIRSGSISELAVQIPAPATGRTSAVQATRVREAGRQNGEGGLRLDLNGYRSVLSGAIPQLSGFVGTPTPGRSAPLEAATVRHPTGNGSESLRRAAPALAPVSRSAA